MHTQSHEIGGIVLSGGKSSRMKTDKGLVKIAGKSLVEYSIDILSPFCSQIYLSANNQKYEKFHLQVIQDVWKGVGPIGGLHASLTASKFQYNIVISCDIPMISTVLIEFLIQNMASDKVTIPLHKNFVEPLCAIYPRNILPYLERSYQQGNFKLFDIISSFGLHKVDVEMNSFYNNDLFRNLNTPEDLEFFSNYMIDK